MNETTNPFFVALLFILRCLVPLDEHDMHVRDNPDLRPARRAAKSPAARTAAHELGHALQISHRQDSDDNLMRSKTYGMRLHADEVRTARRHAGKITLPDTGLDRCGPIIALDTGKQQGQLNTFILRLKATAHLSIIVAFRQVLKRTGGIAKPASLGAPIAALERFISPLAGHQAFFLPAPDFVFVNFKSPTGSGP